ncbi:putative porin [Psychroserpens sp. SPM9]|uniref:putative porin n=1 Tax=Psychroserpens sp. SPM9 TaxID=2975598 RepID=UPI0021A68C35|nr:putative porin [Psychroserpens sp. SPM9]MDG5492620.1 putative porin [Psychroserpens sp. SPM9]
MIKPFYIFILLLCLSNCITAQTLDPNKKLTRNDTTRPLNSNDSSLVDKKGKNVNNKVAKIEQYKIIDAANNIQYVDTSLTITKDYKFNYLRKDNFGLIQFANLGQTYNSLTKEFNSTNLLPAFGARARHFNYFEIEDVNYYEVPTPLTELFFKTAFQQGQLLDAFFTVNTSKQFNFSIAYKGLRSLGNYQNTLTSTGNLRFTSNFKSKNERYFAKAHIVTQDLLNQENGGLKTEDLPNFTSGDEDFIDRSVFDPNFDDAENILVGKRFYLNHEYQLIPQNDSINKSLSIKNIINFEDKYFQYEQTSSSDYFGESFNQSNFRDRVTLENFETKLLVNYKAPIVGDVSFGVGYNDINYGYDKVTILNGQQIPNRLKDQIVSLNGRYSNQFGGFVLNGEIGANIIGQFDSNFFLAEASYAITDDINLKGRIGFNSNSPNYNLLLYQSDYINYNWNNIEGFKNQDNYNFTIELKSKKLFNASFQHLTIDNFAFFSSEVDTSTEDGFNIIKPEQLLQSINLYKLRLDKEIKFGKFALDNSILYQKVNDDTQSLNLPELILRNTLYYSNHFFEKKALYLQTGITFNYFTDYYMDGYDPLLAEFYSQNETKIGGFPRLDFFINAKIRQTRIFLKAEHFNSSFTGYDYFSAPNNPYRDFTVRFGLVWNFFL